MNNNLHDLSNAMNDVRTKINKALSTIKIFRPNVQKVKDFIDLSGRKYPTTPTMPDDKQRKLFLDLLWEELLELAGSFGYKAYYNFLVRVQRFCTRELQNLKAQNGNYRVKVEEDIVETLDALVDIEYVLHNATIGCGLTDYYPEAFEAVQSSNMTKGTTNLVIRNNTLESFRNLEIEVESVIVGERHVILRSSDGKVLKPLDYKPANLHLVLYPSDRLAVTKESHQEILDFVQARESNCLPLYGNDKNGNNFVIGSKCRKTGERKYYKWTVIPRIAK